MIKFRIGSIIRRQRKVLMVLVFVGMFYVSLLTSTTTLSHPNKGVEMKESTDEFSWQDSCVKRLQSYISHYYLWQNNHKNHTNPQQQQYLDNHGRHQPRLWKCGYEVRSMALPLQIAAEYSTAPATTMVRQNANESEPQDLLIYGLGGWCDGWGAEKLGEAWIANHFKGTTIYVNGEWFGGLSWQNESQSPPIHQYHIGYVRDSCQSVRVHSVVWILLEDPQDLDRLSDPMKKPQTTEEEFLVYSQGNCVDYREKAFDDLSSIGEVHFAGRCKGKKSSYYPKVPTPWKVTRSGFWSNVATYGHYRFCLVMENCLLEDYITEKILLAFKAGCVPIYYGTPEILKLFNPQAFIYYNVTDEQSIQNTLEYIAYLESNRTAYRQVLSQPPMLASAIDKYFSMSESVGDGSLLRKVLNMLLYTTPTRVGL
jgi:hypothetical protein